ncbi:MAG TPA: CHC2 zinc finger domain-containing protein [Solirubrobacteraceae bacterium]|jgi:DNA primase
MPLYTPDSKDRVRDAVDMVELVSTRTELRRAGPTSYEGLCPFHDERTPSFSVEPIKKVYYCFGCQASGDAFTFVQETEGVDFKGALELLADRYGIELQLEREDPQEAQRRQRRERLLELLARTAAYYERYLWESTEARHARDYLEGRGLGEAVLREYRVGYAPSAWDSVLVASRRGGFSEAELYATGLAQRSQENGRPYDRFRARIMFPLCDIRGRVLGFGARSIRGEQEGGGNRASRVEGERERTTARSPKYLNTADNDIYHKGLHLYGADLARVAAARAGEAILCEGYTDVIALRQAGLQNAVGLMGTALTGEQVGELGRMAPTVLLALDADSAGQEAMLRAAGLAARQRLELRVVRLPGGMDPAELVQREGAEAMNRAVAASVPFVRFRVARVLDSGEHSSPEGRDRMLDELRPVFAALAPSAMRMELTQLVAGRLELPESLAETLLAEAPAARRGDRGSAATQGATAVGEGGREVGGAGSRPRAGAREDGAGRASETRPAEVARDRVALPAAGGEGGGRLARRQETERTFLALCIASPEDGARALNALDPEEHFTSERLRRAAAHLRAGRLPEPMAGIDEQDPELTAVLAELVVQAGREFPVPAMLEVQRMQLELARLDRRIRGARAARGEESGGEAVSELARRRAEVKRDFELAYERALEQTGG